MPGITRDINASLEYGKYHCIRPPLSLLGVGVPDGASSDGGGASPLSPSPTTMTVTSPPATMTTSVRLPTYTATGTPIVLSNSPLNGSNASARKDAVGPAPTPIEGCSTYPDAWDAVGKDFTWTCGGP